MLAIPQNKVDEIIFHANHALEYLCPENVSVRTTTMWTLGYAYQLQGDLASATQAHLEALKISRASGNTMISLAALTSLGQIQVSKNELFQAAEYFQRVLKLAGDPPLPAACEAHLGLARINYQWNDLEAAQKYGEQSQRLAQKMDNVDTPVNCELLFTRLKLAQGDVDGAVENLKNAERLIQAHHFSHLMPEFAALHVCNKGNRSKAAELAENENLTHSLARVHLAEGDASGALQVLTPYRQAMETQSWKDKQLKAIILQAVATHALGNKAQAVDLLGEALTLAEPGGLIRIFLNEGPPMVDLLTQAAAQGMKPIYISKLLAAFDGEETGTVKPDLLLSQPLPEPLSERELEILQLIAGGLSNREISQRLFLALNTIKGYNQKIFGKLQVQRRTEAVARARELNLL
jgi:LuxR family maltose regulon positive regulatory protein